MKKTINPYLLLIVGAILTYGTHLVIQGIWADLLALLGELLLLFGIVEVVRTTVKKRKA